MSYETARKAIVDRFIAQWGSTTATCGLPGHPFTPPVGAASARLDILDGAATQISIGAPGSNLARYAGVARVHLYVPAAEGEKAWRTLAETACGIFRNHIIASPAITFSYGGLLPYIAARIDEPPFSVVTIAAPFVRDEHHA